MNGGICTGRGVQMFEDISIIGRAAYGFCSLEEYLKEIGGYTSAWDILFDKLWAFPQCEFVDEYTYMLIECLPDSILEFEDYSEGGDWEYITEEEFLYFRSLYRYCTELQNVSKILNDVHEMLSNHLYEGTCPPAQASLDIMNHDLYPFLEGLLTKLPTTEAFLIYSIRDCGCWGIFHPKEVLLKEMRVCSGSEIPESMAVADRVNIELDNKKILEIVRDSKRFVSPFSDWSGYCILATPRQTVDGRNEGLVQFYLQKLKYAVTFADSLIENAFQSEFYEFYGVNRDLVKSPEDMCQQLIFDSFVLMSEKRTINACLSSEVFMFGHYIEFCWDYDWNLMYCEIC